MAKKSAMSKGYRKTIKKKPFLTKKEIIELVVILAVILVAIVLFNIFYDDGFIKESKIQEGDIVCHAGKDLRDRYKKVGEIGEIEGFTLNAPDETSSAISYYTFVPDGEADNITSIVVNGSFVPALDLANSTITYMQGGLENVPTVQETEIQGHNAYVFAYDFSEYVAPAEEEAAEETAVEETEETAAEEPAAEATEEETAEEEAAEETAEPAAEAEEPAPNSFSQTVSAYIDVEGTHTLCVHIYRHGDDDSFFISEEEVIDFLSRYESAYTVAEAE